MSEATMGRLFRKELAKEKAHIHGRPRKTTPSALEIAAEAWQAEQERAKQAPLQADEESSFTPLSGAQAGAVMQPTAPVQTPWAQFNPWKDPEEEEKKQSPRRLNTVTIYCMAKKIMAREWRRAKGIKKPDPRLIELEKSAREYEYRKMQEEEEKRQRALRLEREHKRILDCLGSFVDSMLDKRQQKRIASLEDVEVLIAAAFGSLGEVFDVQWTDDGGCAIWLEPWPERRERRARGDVRPALRRFNLDARLNMSGYERVTDPAVWRERQKNLMLRPLHLSQREIKRLGTAQQARDFLTERAGEAGRVLGITSQDGFWKIRLQPWDEVRVRNLKKSSKGPVTEYEITVGKDFQNLSCKCLEG